MEKSKKFTLYSVLATIAVFAASFYPLYMGARVISDMIAYGTVQSENYPKYIIPYTPISVAVILGVLLMPIILKHVKRRPTLLASGISVVIFLVTETLLENMVVVTTQGSSSIENWQTYMCAVPPEGFASRTWTSVNILGGEFDPLYKLHFYVIAILMVLALINCLYGFGRMVQTGDTKRRRSLILLSIVSGLFLGLCIWACFTAFYRGGELLVSPTSAWLMGIFFVTLGVTCGLFAGSFLQDRKKSIAVIVPTLLAMLMAVVMYMGELILLHGHLYQFGTGWFYERILFLAPVDYLIVLFSGVITAGITLASAPRSEAKMNIEQNASQDTRCDD